MLVVALLKRWNWNTGWRLLKLEGWVSWIPKSELISVFEFRLKFPFCKPVSCNRLAWLLPLAWTAVFLLQDYEFIISCLEKVGAVIRVHVLALVAIG